MGKTSIEWTQHTWNPVRGCSMAKGSCSPVDGGCFNCYAARIAAQNRPAQRSPSTGKPFAIFTPKGPRWTGDVELIEKALTIPLRRRKPTTYFVNSMSDLFHEDLPDHAIDRICAVMGMCPQHYFQVLTKRAERLPQHFADLKRRAFLAEQQREWVYDNARREPVWYPELRWPLPNLWLGVSCENQKTADERIPHLLKTPAAVRFLSLEPLLGPSDLGDYLGHHLGCDGEAYPCPICGSNGRVDWVIVGGESGPGARPIHPAWVRSIRDQCIAAGVPFFFKQWGGWSPKTVNRSGSVVEAANVGSRGEWASRKTRLPYAADMIRVGKKKAGRELDGRTWDEMPGVKEAAHG